LKALALRAIALQAEKQRQDVDQVRAAHPQARKAHRDVDHTAHGIGLRGLKAIQHGVQIQPVIGILKARKGVGGGGRALAAACRGQQQRKANQQRGDARGARVHTASS
jgi:hypothetical protein